MLSGERTQLITTLRSRKGKERLRSTCTIFIWSTENPHSLYHGKLRFEGFGKTRRKRETPSRSPSISLCLSFSACSSSVASLCISDILSHSLKLELSSSISLLYIAADTHTRVHKYTHVSANSISITIRKGIPSAVFTDERGSQCHAVCTPKKLSSQPYRPGGKCLVLWSSLERRARSRALGE